MESVVKSSRAEAVIELSGWAVVIETASGGFL